MSSLKNIGLTICFLGFVFSSSAWAGSLANNVIASPAWNEYSDNDLLSAGTLNNHFDAIADAVNDNDTRITDIEAQGGLAGADAVIEPGVVGIPQSNTTLTQVASIIVSAPSAGYILVTHSGSVVSFAEPNTIELGIGDTTSAFTSSTRVGSLDAVSTNRNYHAYSTSYLYTVTTAGDYTYYGLAQKNTTFDGGLINVVPQSMTAIFVPNNY